jgi:hypothetical protein
MRMGLKTRRNNAILALVVGTLLSAPTIAADAADQFAVGQEWSVKPAGKDSSTSLHVIIDKIEPSEGQTILHVSITGITCPNGNTVSLGHAPIDATALSASVDHIVATGVQPAHGFAESYANWKAERGGSWSVSVPEIAAGLLQEVGPEKIGCLNKSDH